MSRAFTVPRQILTGTWTLEAAMPLLAEMGTHALIVTGQIVCNLPCFQTLTAGLDACPLRHWRRAWPSTTPR